MTTAPYVIRASQPGDSADIHRIYEHYVLHGTASWELTPPNHEELEQRRLALVGNGLPFLVSEYQDQIVGFAYAGPFRPRAGYRFTVEDSIYIDPNFQNRGIGEALLRALIDICETKGYRQMVSVIGDSQNNASIALHRKLGFVDAGRLTNTGVKFGRWLDTVFMQRSLGEGANTAPPEP